MSANFKISGMEFDSIDLALVLKTQNGLPIVNRPFFDLANELNISEIEIINRLNKMKEVGFVRKVAGTPNHYKIGYIANAMTVWDIPEDKVELVGMYFKSVGFISHCYIRPRALPEWRYNLFAMVHGHTKDEVDLIVKRLADEMRENFSDMTLLYSSKILKKTGIRLKVAESV